MDSVEELLRVLAVYERRRMWRVGVVAAAAKQEFEAFTMPGGPGREPRDWKMWTDEKMGEMAEQVMPQVSLEADDVLDEDLSLMCGF